MPMRRRLSVLSNSVPGSRRKELSDTFSDSELNGSRVRRIGQPTKSLNSINRPEWQRGAVNLVPMYEVHPETRLRFDGVGEEYEI